MPGKEAKLEQYRRESQKSIVRDFEKYLKSVGITKQFQVSRY